MFQNCGPKGRKPSTLLNKLKTELSFFLYLLHLIRSIRSQKLLRNGTLPHWESEEQKCLKWIRFKGKNIRSRWVWSLRRLQADRKSIEFRHWLFVSIWYKKISLSKNKRFLACQNKLLQTGFQYNYICVSTKSSLLLVKTLYTNMNVKCPKMRFFSMQVLGVIIEKKYRFFNCIILVTKNVCFI